MSMVKKTHGDWLDVLRFRTAKSTGKFTLIPDGNNVRKIWEFQYPDGEVFFVTPEMYNAYAGIHFNGNAWVKMTIEEYLAS